MKTKFDGIVSEENLEIIDTTIGQMDLPEKQKKNLVETVANIIYLNEKFFDKLDLRTKVYALLAITLTFDTLMDELINPYASKLLHRAIHCFNNNIFGIEGSVSICPRIANDLN